MGRAKQGQFDQEEKTNRALALCVEIGAIEICDSHEDTYIDTLEYSDYDELTTAILKNNPDSIDFFDNRDDMLDSIGDAMGSAGDECGSCEKNRNS
ncbi:hypothetical protein SAMN04515617_1194 [Collimonas sp. OK242]|uniref:hypothetical protein n=1 Tax=Collimonas sp. OK242 TaxID=1798195 RepID=UPI00089A8912|nr:hypothetical protein [Collimonas sp. OK242]SDY67394.1 hypothetical protein SAMN04515617_1194 [Collimonas sp. OK242]